MILGGKDSCGCEFYFVSLVGVPLVLYGCHLPRALSARLVLCAEHEELSELLTWADLGEGKENILFCAIF